MPVSLLGFGIALGEEHWNLGRAAALGFGFAGLAVLFGPQVMVPDDLLGLLAAAAIVFSAVVYSLGSVIARPLTKATSTAFMSRTDLVAWRSGANAGRLGVRARGAGSGSLRLGHCRLARLAFPGRVWLARRLHCLSATDRRLGSCAGRQLRLCFSGDSCAAWRSRIRRNGGTARWPRHGVVACCCLLFAAGIGTQSPLSKLQSGRITQSRAQQDCLNQEGARHGLVARLRINGSFPPTSAKRSIAQIKVAVASSPPPTAWRPRGRRSPPARCSAP